MHRSFALFATCLALFLPGTAGADLFFSEYVEGSSYNKALEIFNDSASSVDLSGFSVRVYSNGNGDSSNTIDLAGTLLPFDVFVLCHTSADDEIKIQADLSTGSLNFTGNDAVDLFGLGQTHDVFGQIGFDPGSYWGDADKKSQDMTLVRSADIHQGDPLGSDPFTLEEWTAIPKDTFSNLGTHQTNAVPLPPAVWLLGSGLLAMVCFGKNRKRT